MKTFIAQNGEEVAKLVTPSGVTAYIATSIPAEAIKGFRRKMELVMRQHEVARGRGPVKGRQIGLNGESGLSVVAEWDDEVGLWFATSDDVPRLVIEAETLEALAEKLKRQVPELLAEYETEGKIEMIELVTRQRIGLDLAP